MLKKFRNDILKLTEKYSELFFAQKDFIKNSSDVPVSGKCIGKEELKNMVEASLDGWLTTGRFNDEFQKKLSSFLGVKCLLTVNSGSSANLVAFSTLTSPKLGERTIRKGDEIITVAASFPTTVNPILQFGCVPVFLDIKIPTYNIDEKLVEEAITSKTKAIMIAHTLGNPFNVKKIKDICIKNNLWLIEDTCDALGSKYNNQLVGTYGDLATLSFYPAHHITMGEGGAVFTNSIKLKRIAESFRDWGRDCYCEPGKDNTCNKRFDWQLGDLPYGYDHKYTYSHMGYNLKITDMQAACGLAQLYKLENFIQTRKNNYDFLYKNLKELEEFIILPEPEENSEPSWFGFPISLRKNNKYSRNDLVKHLNKNKIGTRLLFSGNLIKQPFMKDAQYRLHGEIKNTDFVMENTFWIGLYPGLSKEHLEYSIEKIEIFFKSI
jgi:CDP-6-deoxy-D-xylo-4-hexulose-3-dehydrase